jgi:hypothetical protein
MSNPEAPDLTFDGMAVGDVLVDSTVTVTAESIAQFRRSIATDTATLDGLEEGYAPPTMAAMWTVPRVMFREWNVPVGGIHARQRWQCTRPIRAGSALRVRISLKEKYVRKDRPWVVFESRLSDLDGVDVACGEMTVVWPV